MRIHSLHIARCKKHKVLCSCELQKEIAAEAKAAGFDPKLIRRRVRENLMSAADKTKHDREEAEYEAMCLALGL